MLAGDALVAGGLDITGWKLHGYSLLVLSSQDCIWKRDVAVVRPCVIGGAANVSVTPPPLQLPLPPVGSFLVNNDFISLDIYLSNIWLVVRTYNFRNGKGGRGSL